MNSVEIKKYDSECIAGTYGRFDMAADHGKGATCISADGQEYIDFTSGIGVNSLGFCNDAWVKAVTEQAGKLQHVSNLYYTEPQVRLAKALTERTGMKKAFFCNSGAEANEFAIKVARKFGGHEVNRVITLIDSFHGRTMATITATGQDHYHEYFTPFVDGFDYCRAGDIDMLESLVKDDTCAILIELVQGEGGVINLDEEFVKKAESLCREKNMLLMIDEVQTGIGRTGNLFAYEAFGIKPDVVTFAKGIGAGLPIGGALLSEKCCDVMKPGDHGTTFGGNPVAAAGAVAVLDQMDDAFLEEVKKKGEYIREKLTSMGEVESVSGMGLMIGIKLKTKDKSEVVKEALKEGLMILTAGGKVRMLPPLVITKEEIDKGLAIFEKVIG